MSEPSPPPPSRAFRGLAVGVFVTVLALAVLAATGQWLFGSKFGRAFPASADALAGAETGTPRPAPAGADAGAPALPPGDGASAPGEVGSPDEGRFLGATKAGPLFVGTRAQVDAGSGADGGPRRERFLGATKAGPVFLDDAPAPQAPSPAQQAPAQDGR